MRLQLLTIPPQPQLISPLVLHWVYGQLDDLLTEKTWRTLDYPDLSYTVCCPIQS